MKSNRAKPKNQSRKQHNVCDCSSIKEGTSQFSLIYKQELKEKDPGIESIEKLHEKK